MKIFNKRILQKLIRKNRGNVKLVRSVEKLIKDFEENNWSNAYKLAETRKDADCVYGGDFFFFNIHIHRTLVLVQFDEIGTATIIWVGNHHEYETVFKNNKNVIKKWLRDNSWI